MKERQISNLLQAFYTKTLKDQANAGIYEKDNVDFNTPLRDGAQVSNKDQHSEGMQKLRKYLNSYA
jgi:hypothetical protein